MAKALEVTRKNLDMFTKKYITHRDRLINGILRKFPQTVLTGSKENRLSNHTSFAFPGIDGNELVMALDLEGFSCSSGSACKTGNPEPSDVLLAMGFDRDYARGSLRLTVGRNTTEEDVDRFLNILPIVIARLQ
jgi:cysteine desulfurase